MKGEWHTLHRIEEVSNLIGLLREYEANTISRNAMRCNNRYDFLNLSFILKIPIFSKVYLPSRTYMVQLFLRKLFVGFSRKSSITDVRLDCKYVSTFTLTPFLSLKYIYFLIHQPCCLMLFNSQHTIKTLLSNDLLIR